MINYHNKTIRPISNTENGETSNGKIRLHETWEWTSGDQSKGQSIIEEQ